MEHFEGDSRNLAGMFLHNSAYTVEPACKVHGRTVFSDVRSISSWSQSESDIPSYNTDVRSTFFGQKADLTKGLKCSSEKVEGFTKDVGKMSLPTPPQRDWGKVQLGWKKFAYLASTAIRRFSTSWREVQGFRRLV